MLKEILSAHINADNFKAVKKKRKYKEKRVGGGVTAEWSDEAVSRPAWSPSPR